MTGSSGARRDDDFADTARRLRDGRSVDEVHQIVVDSALTLIDGCDRAAIGVLEGSKFRTAAATDAVTREIDRFQDQVGEGPCLEASTEGVAQVDNDITVHSTWPRLAELVVAHTPVRAMLAVPLVDEGHRHGALDLFSDSVNAFDDEAIGAAAILASLASVALAGAHHAARADQLEEGMTTNREIGTAVGILMATHGIGQDEAFRMLSQASQRLNRKLRDIAAGIVRGDDERGQ
jgi:GAF domain-containing protein